MTRFMIGLVLGSVLTAGVGFTQVQGYGENSRYQRQQLDLLRQQNRILQQRNFQQQLPVIPRQPC